MGLDINDIQNAVSSPLSFQIFGFLYQRNIVDVSTVPFNGITVLVQKNKRDLAGKKQI